MSTLIDTIKDHLTKLASDRDWIEERARRFSKEGFCYVTGIMPEEAVGKVREDAIRLADQYSSHWKTNLATTGFSPRDMDVVMSEDIGRNSELIAQIYRLPELRSVLEKVSLAQVFDMPEVNEELFLSRHTKPGNTHGWHWGDYSYAMCWILLVPPMDAGGMLQCVPHTTWIKEDRNVVNSYLSQNRIATYPFSSGDIYWLKTDTTMHRTTPLTRDCLRIMLNMAWAGYVNARKSMEGIEWWETDARRAAAGDERRHKPLGAEIRRPAA